MAQEVSGQKNQKPSNPLIKYSSLGLQLAAGIGAAAWMGYWLDRKLNLKFPVFLISFVFIMFAGMVYQVYRSLDK